MNLTEVAECIGIKPQDILTHVDECIEVSLKDSSVVLRTYKGKQKKYKDEQWVLFFLPITTYLLKYPYAILVNPYLPAKYNEDLHIVHLDERLYIRATIRFQWSVVDLSINKSYSRSLIADNYTRECVCTPRRQKEETELDNIGMAALQFTAPSKISYYYRGSMVTRYLHHNDRGTLKITTKPPTGFPKL
jgi:hypothetical protein